MVVGTGLRWDDGSALEVDGGRGERDLTDALSATQLHDFAISIFFYVLPKGKRGTQLSSVAILSVCVSSAASPSCSRCCPPPAQSDCSRLLFSSAELRPGPGCVSSGHPGRGG